MEDSLQCVKPFRSRFLSNNKNVFDYNAWDNVQWDAEQETSARRRVAEHVLERPPEGAEERLKTASECRRWDEFYSRHEDRFFKQRSWLLSEFPFLSDTDSNRCMWECGCGTGSVVLPLLRSTQRMFVYASDFSSRAVSLLSSSVRERDLSSRCHVFEHDLTSACEEHVPFAPNSLDAIVLVFVLSAIQPSLHSDVVRRLCVYLKPGGRLMFRDYAQHDMTQLRMSASRCVGADLYVRGDNTLVYYFKLDEVRRLFTGVTEEHQEVEHGEGGLEECELALDRRLQVNRATQQKMYRIWVQAEYRKTS